MSKIKFEIYKCDRCGHEEEIRHFRNTYDWASIYANQVNGPFRIGNDSAENPKARDICPTCTKDLKVWWESKS